MMRVRPSMASWQPTGSGPRRGWSIGGTVRLGCTPWKGEGLWPSVVCGAWGDGAAVCQADQAWRRSDAAWQLGASSESGATLGSGEADHSWSVCLSVSFGAALFSRGSQGSLRGLAGHPECRGGQAMEVLMFLYRTASIVSTGRANPKDFFRRRTLGVGKGSRKIGKMHRFLDFPFRLLARADEA